MLNIQNNLRLKKTSITLSNSMKNKTLIKDLLANGFVNSFSIRKNKVIATLKFDKYGNSAIKELSNISNNHRRVNYSTKGLDYRYHDLSHLLFKSLKQSQKSSKCIHILR